MYVRFVFLFLCSLFKQSDKQSVFVLLFPHVKHTYVADHQITDAHSDTPPDQLDFTTEIPDMKQQID